MIRITKLTDYGIVLLAHIAMDADYQLHNVKDLAAEAHLPMPTVSKLLKLLTRGGLLISLRGPKGGYKLARSPEAISIAQIIAAIDGPIAITDCSSSNVVKCELERLCPVRSNWQKINGAIRDSLEIVTLAEMTGKPIHHFNPLNVIPLSPIRKEVQEICP